MHNHNVWGDCSLFPLGLSKKKTTVLFPTKSSWRARLIFTDLSAALRMFFLYCEPEKHISSLQIPAVDKMSVRALMISLCTLCSHASDYSRCVWKCCASTHTSFKYNESWDWLLHSMTLTLSLSVRAEYKPEKRGTDLALVAHYLKLCCLSVQLAVRWRRANM